MTKKYNTNCKDDVTKKQTLLMRFTPLVFLLVLFCFFSVLFSCSHDNLEEKKDPTTENPKPDEEPKNPDTPSTPENNAGLKDLISKEQFLVLFPYRYGAEQSNNWIVNPSKDFYTYDALMKAVDLMADLKVVIERKGWFQKITRIKKSTNETKVIKEDADFSASWNNNTVVRQEVDYADFISIGSLEVRKRELAAFLANISHETTGGWSTAPGGAYSWGLYFREEVGYDENSTTGYREENNVDYPPVAKKSYHGRGPIQLSWNYNYGQISEFLYGDKNVLLKNPENVVKDAALAFQTAIWFWMTPQAPKPSCHAVMVGQWLPTQQDINEGRKPGFGATINIINGALECNKADSDKTQSRRGFYQRYLTVLNTSDPNCECQCDKMQPFK
ncbi:chitinase [Flavobacterium tructae]|uniref:chitinase n=1 Tax=Flavobacterium tructae TaxID=1114873 RepID=UPI0025520682|nr:chitinase [Flavobacterium tructae]MDL2143084.1 chitinase [Flavobacterium tructae]